MSKVWPSAQPWSSIERYYGSDCFKGNNDIEPKGFPETYTEEQMIALAIKYRCPLIARGGINGKWYLKCKNKKYEVLTQKLIEHTGKNTFKNCYAILIKYE